MSLINSHPEDILKGEPNELQFLGDKFFNFHFLKIIYFRETERQRQ